MSSQIRIFGARQNNLKNLDISFDTGTFTVITGVSGSGKSSLAFDTLYAEGQRKYVETFSPYARQFLDRMDKPNVDKIEGILPAIAIDQTNPVRNSRSSVGTMTELNDHIKLIYARASHLFCRQCAQEVKKDNASSIYEQIVALSKTHDDPRLIFTFAVQIPENFKDEEIKAFLEQQGYTRIHCETEKETLIPPTGRSKKTKVVKNKLLYVIQDRLRFDPSEKNRILEAIDACLQHGNGKCSVFQHNPDEDVATQLSKAWNFSNKLHCAACNIDYQTPLPSTFSFNSPLGACEACRGFGRIMGIDYGLVVPDENLSLEEGAIKPWQTPSFIDCQKELLKYAKQEGVRTNVPYKQLNEAELHWITYGDPNWKGGDLAWKTQWYGSKRFFEWLESRSYKMHVRVLLSKYRSYTPCPSCEGSRLKPNANLWRLGNKSFTDPKMGTYPRFKPVHACWTNEQLNQQPGLAIHDLMRLPIYEVHRFFSELSLDGFMDSAMDLVLGEIKNRLHFLCEVGLGYLSLDRQSRTLSGGEVQRINLTTALGTSLVNTLFVLDEPSIGLHPSDMHRITKVMHRLVKAGNTLVVVEHDPQVMVAADRIIDMGPGPGERGGQVMFDGTANNLRHASTLTGKYLSGLLKIQAPRAQAVSPNTPKLLLQGVSANNLKNIDLELPLQRFVCITGVSGSGKSSLVQNVLYPAMLKYLGKPSEAPGQYTHLLGCEQIADVIMVDQSPIGKTTRSNPVSYVGAFDAIRKLFAQAPLAKEREYTAGTFSFNGGTGRCPSCTGTGFEHIEMQFLSDVYIRCSDCDGKRYRKETLEVKIDHLGKQASIDEVLAMTVSEALEFFKGLKEVQTRLAPLSDVGLDYLALGQPVPTLSGGEAQRLKLAGYLAEASQSKLAKAAVAKKGNLFLFDEPTTGLHFDDIAKLMMAFRKLLAAGHSLLIIEHNLDIIRNADYVVDLGPEGGDAGGYIVAKGTPEEIMQVSESKTGQALLEYETDIIKVGYSQSLKVAEATTTYNEGLGTPLQKALQRNNSIEILNAKEHNLKGINASIPRDTFTVITGVSGSGKSTLAFDILFNEGQRRYLESLNAYARAVVQPAGKPDVDAIYGIPPTVAIEQRTSRGGRKSTVATMTEVHHFLRLLYVKLGTQYCPCCQVAVVPQSSDQIFAHIMREHKGQHIGVLAPLVSARKGYYTDLAKWAENKGYTHLRVDGVFTPVKPWPRLDRYKEHTIELPVADFVVDAKEETTLQEALAKALDHGQGNLSIIWDLSQQDINSTELKQHHFSTKRSCPSCGNSFPEPDPRLFSYNSKHGWCNSCFGTGVSLNNFDAEQTGEESQWLNQEEDEHIHACQACNGLRLNPIAQAVLWKDKSIVEITQWSVSDAATFFNSLILKGREADIARDIMSEMKNRLSFMEEVGLGYLGLDRAAPTLSGGEAQRIRLAAQLGSNLQGVCYVLDEPTIGLHPRDNRILLNALSRLESNGNTLVVVEHDEDTIRRASHVIDMGPGAGIRGGQIVAQGTVQQLMDSPNSLTGKFLKNPLQHPMQARRPVPKDQESIEIRQAGLHNLHNVNARVPLNRLTVITGVSGSGKSSLARDVLLSNLKGVVGQKVTPKWSGCAAILNWEKLDRVLEVDQTPIGKTPRSCPATYVGFWDDIRKLFANARDAKIRGWTASRFSFNTGDGRCPICEGQGMRTIEMSFLPDIKVPCDACFGQRFNEDTLSIKLRDKSIGDVLSMEIDDAVEYFANHAKILSPLKLLQDVGLGYLTLGQASPTLSGGEAQRIKLVTELVKARLDIGVTKTGRASRLPHTLYVLDEPTVGLSIADVEKLIHVLHRLVEAGNTVVVIEHNIDVMAEADWIIDMGPEGGNGGGQVVASGTPEDLVKLAKISHTGLVLKETLK